MARILSLLHASLLVADTGRSLAFYCDVLGFEPDAGRPELGYPGAWLQVGSQQVHLLELPNPDATAARPAHGGRDRHIAFAVSGLDEMAAALERHGIAFTRSRSGRQALFCRDPDGNALEFIEAGSPA